LLQLSDAATPENGVMSSMTLSPGRCIGAALHPVAGQQQEQGENLFHPSWQKA
jgi:hypothetical protein